VLGGCAIVGFIDGVRATNLQRASLAAVAEHWDGPPRAATCSPEHWATGTGRHVRHVRHVLP
jgi:hypothetical protein